MERLNFAVSQYSLIILTMSSPVLCEYVFSRGKSSGLKCGKKCKELTYCRLHILTKSVKKRIEKSKEIIVEESEKKDGKILSSSQQNALASVRNNIEKIVLPTTIEDFYYDLCKYISECPITINFSVSILGNLVNDTHYRNQFETNTSGGLNSPSTREIWENRLFENNYSSSKPSERVKYGCINLNPLSKDTDASSYGTSYFILKESVKNRCTITFGDSGSLCSTSLCKPNIYDFKSVIHMLYHELTTIPTTKENIYSYTSCKDYLNMCYDAYTKNSHHGNSKWFKRYIEVQIHGDVLFSEDIDTLVLQFNSWDYSDKEPYILMAKQFAEKNSFKLKVIPSIS